MGVSTKTKIVTCLCLFTLLPALYAQNPNSIPKIVVITFKAEGFHNAFWDAIQAGARKAAKSLGVSIEYRGLAPEFVDKRVEGQTLLFDEYIQKGFQGIIFTPSDRIRMAGPVKKAVAAGLKVVALDSALESPLLSGIFATNNYEGGRKAAQAMAEAINFKGSVLMLAHPARDNKATRDRELAFAAELRNNFPNITLVSQDRFGGATIETDLVAVRALLDDFPKVNGVYAVSGSGLEAFMLVIEERKLAGKISLVGWDSGPNVLAGLRRGTVSAIIQQDPERMASEGVAALVQALGGHEQRQLVDTGVFVITQKNMASKEAQNLLDPDLAGWIH